MNNAAWVAEYEAAENRPQTAPARDVTLSPDILTWLLRVAHDRNDGKTREQSRHVLVDQFGDLVMDFLGVKGEYVVSQTYGVPFDERGYGARGDDGVDIRTPEPGAIKANHRRGGFLLIERWSDIDKVEVIHLVDGLCDPPMRCSCSLQTSDPERFRYVGWITVEDFRQGSAFANWGLGPRRYCKQAQLCKTALYKR